MRRTMPIMDVGIDKSRCDELVPGIDLAINRSVEGDTAADELDDRVCRIEVKRPFGGRPDKNDSVVLIDDHAVADELVRSARMTDNPARPDCSSHSDNPPAATHPSLRRYCNSVPCPSRKRALRSSITSSASERMTLDLKNMAPPAEPLTFCKTTGLPLQTERQWRRQWGPLPLLRSRPTGNSATVGLRW